MRYQTFATWVRRHRQQRLAMAYIACGRLDAHVEEQISIWGVAAGIMLVEAGGGKVMLRPGSAKAGTMFICASNGKIPIEQYL